MSSQQKSNIMAPNNSKHHTMASEMLQRYRPSRPIHSAEQILSRQVINPDIPAPLVYIDNLPPPHSPATPSPVGSQQLKFILQRLEEIDIESRELLKMLFSLLEKDERLERYIRQRLDNPKVSRMWELVEKILASKQGTDGTINLDELEMDSNYMENMDKGIKVSHESDNEISTRLERFKIRTLATGDTGSTEMGSANTSMK